MRQEFGDQMVFVRGQALQHIFEVSVEVVPIEPGALNQAHDDSRTLACLQGACTAIWLLLLACRSKNLRRE